MKTYSYSNRHALILMMACFLFVGALSMSQAIGSDARSHRAYAGSAVGYPMDPARLIIRRTPDLGYNIIVTLFIDGVPVTGIAYGHTFEGYLRPGLHVLSVLPAPGPKWTTPTDLTLHVRRGHAYTFTAMGDHSGHLILEGEHGPFRSAYGWN